MASVSLVSSAVTWAPTAVSTPASFAFSAASVVPSCASKSALVAPKLPATSAIAFCVAASRVMPAASLTAMASVSLVSSAVTPVLTPAMSTPRSANCLLRSAFTKLIASVVSLLLPVVSEFNCSMIELYLAASSPAVALPARSDSEYTPTSFATSAAVGFARPRAAYAASTSPLSVTLGSV